MGIEQRGALQEAVHGQRHHDRRQSQRDDANAVGEPDEASQNQNRRQRIEERCVRPLHHAGEQDAAETDRPGHGQIEAAGQDHRPLAERQDGEEA